MAASYPTGWPATVQLPYHATIDRLTEQLNSKQDALSAALLALDNAVERCVGFEVELARYKQGVEVEVTVDSYDYDTSFICEDIKLPSEFRGQRVRVLVMKVEE